MRLARLISGNAEDAWDLTQDCLIRIGMRWDKIEASGNPSAYARATLVNLSKNVRRSRGRERARIESLAAMSRETIHSTVPDWLVDTLAELTPRQRAVIALHFLEDRDNREIAGILQCSESTVRSHLSRGLSRLRASVPER